MVEPERRALRTWFDHAPPPLAGAWTFVAAARAVSTLVATPRRRQQRNPAKGSTDAGRRPPETLRSASTAVPGEAAASPPLE